MCCLLSAVAHGAVTYIYTDPQGTVLAEADASGNVTSQSDYRPYGARAMGSATNGPGFTGHVGDAETGVIYMQARYYFPDVGSFASVDPKGVDAGGVFTFSRYLYVSANPINKIDPNGMFGRGTGFTDKQWAAFDKAQKAEAIKLHKAADKLMSALEKATAAGSDDLESAGKSFEKSFGKGTAKSDNVASTVGNLAAMAAALDDDGSNGYVANALTGPQAAALHLDPQTSLAAAPVNSKVMYANTSHPQFNNVALLSWAVGHESGHDIGLEHGLVNGVIGYKFGDSDQREAFKAMPSVSPSEALHNPDTLIDFAR
jgi:RHS repeat-associated protein